jgi:hypothetical protein
VPSRLRRQSRRRPLSWRTETAEEWPTTVSIRADLKPIFISRQLGFNPCHQPVRNPQCQKFLSGIRSQLSRRAETAGQWPATISNRAGLKRSFQFKTISNQCTNLAQKRWHNVAAGVGGWRAA